jgi:hypothetical protein
MEIPVAGKALFAGRAVFLTMHEGDSKSDQANSGREECYEDRKRHTYPERLASKSD